MVAKPQKVGGLPWIGIAVIGLFNREMYETHEMRYLWSVPHRMDGSKLRAFLPDFTPTPGARAIKQALGA